ELAPPHSITSSARSNNASGILSPSALAVVRLMTRLNLVGCSTGMSPGFVPRRIDDASTIGLNECIADHVKCVRLCLERLEGGSDILYSPNFKWRNFKAERASLDLNLAHLQHALRKADIPHDC